MIIEGGEHKTVDPLSSEPLHDSDLLFTVIFADRTAPGNVDGDPLGF